MASLLAPAFAPAAFLFYTALFLLVVWLYPPAGSLYPTIEQLQEWLAIVPYPWIPTARNDEILFGSALTVALFVSIWNWLDSAADYFFQRRKRPRSMGEYLASRANFRRESFRVWRTGSMFALGLSVLFNWPITRLLFTYSLLTFSFSEAINSFLDRLYRIRTQEYFRKERESRRRIIVAARSMTAKSAGQTTEAGVQQGKLDAALAENVALVERATEQADRMEAQSEDTNERMRQVVKTIVGPHAENADNPDLTIGQQIEETHDLATKALRTSERAEESAARAEDTATESKQPPKEQA